jgi:thioredoxin 1
MLELQEDNLSQIVSDNDKVFAMFGASWCGMCKMTKPKVKRLSNENEGIQFVYVDAENFVESRDLGGKLSNLPSFAAYVNGEVVFKQ